MIKKYVLAGVALALCGTASAAEPKPTGAYVGGAIGQSTLDDDGAFDFDGVDFDDSDTAFILFGGYKFMPNLSAELRYNNFGTPTLSDPASSDSVGLDVTSWSANLVGMVPFGTGGFEGFAMVGAGKTTLSADDPDADLDESYTSWGFGAGVRYHITDMIAVGVQYDRYTFEVDDSDPTFDPVTSTITASFLVSF